MEIQVRKEGNRHVISVKGRMDAVSSPDFEKELSLLMDKGRKLFVIDFSGLEYISSSGLRSILTIAKKLKATESIIVLASLRSTVKEVFEISGFSTIIPIYATVDDALSNV